MLPPAAMVVALAVSDVKVGAVFPGNGPRWYEKSSDAGVVAAAEFAARTEGEKDGSEITVQSIEIAESQTVAGTNYKLCIEVFRIEAGDDVEVRQFIQTLVFRSLKKEYTLKSWEEAESCGE